MKKWYFGRSAFYSFELKVDRLKAEEESGTRGQNSKGFSPRRGEVRRDLNYSPFEKGGRGNLRCPHADREDSRVRVKC
jgi:hypothetical protein